jgi:hypothetical protein
MMRNRVSGQHIALVGLFVVVVFGALVQAGVLMPKLRVGGGGGSFGGLSQTYTSTIENQSLRSWTITGFQLPEGTRSESLPDGSTVHLDGIYRDADLNPPSQGRSPALLPPLTIGPGQQFTVELVRELAPACGKVPAPRTLAQIHALEARPMPRTHDIPAVITFSTPLGSRSVGTAFSVTYGCEGA